MSDTLLMLMIQYKAASVKLADIAESRLGMSPQEAVRQHSLGKLKVPAYRLNDSQKCPLEVRITDLAELIDKSAQAARERMVA